MLWQSLYDNSVLPECVLLLSELRNLNEGGRSVLLRHDGCTEDLTNVKTGTCDRIRGLHSHLAWT
jgi:hypothetical protein